MKTADLIFLFWVFLPALLLMSVVRCRFGFLPKFRTRLQQQQQFISNYLERQKWQPPKLEFHVGKKS